VASFFGPHCTIVTLYIVVSTQVNRKVMNSLLLWGWDDGSAHKA